MLSNEVELYLGDQVELFAQMLKDSPDGEYYIPEINWVFWDTEQVRMLSKLLDLLPRKFQFSTHEFFNKPGIIVRWKRRN